MPPLDDDLLSRIPRLIRNCRPSESPQHENVLLMPEGILRLKGTGVDIVSLCDGKRMLRDILKELQAKYPGTDSALIEAETLSFLNALKDKRAVDF